MIPIGSDTPSPLADAIIHELGRRGCAVQKLGALTEGAGDCPWPEVARQVADAVASGSAPMGILLCWTGTGVAMAANRNPGVRCALCGDAQTASGARKYNDANILALSNRATSTAVGLEILDAWMATDPSTDPSDAACLAMLNS